MTPSIYRFDHSPAQHFGRVGYDFLAAQVTDLSTHPNDDATRAECDAWWDRQVSLLLLRDAPQPKRLPKGKAESRDEMVVLAGERIGWHRALPELKCWAGNATMLTTVAARVAALIEAGDPTSPLMEWQVPLKTCSGIDARCAPNALDVGFSVATLGIDLMTFAACELLAVLGMQVSRIVRYGYRTYGYIDPEEQWWQFRVVEREGYHRCYTMSCRVGINGGP